MAHRCEFGFTLLEMMFASAVFALALGGVLTLLVGVQRLTRETVARAEMSVRMRELREKLLFHVAPPHDGRVWSGMLSGTDEGSVVEDEGKVKMYTAYGYDTSARQAYAQRIELVQRTQGLSDAARRWLGNDADRADERWETPWLCPGGYSNLPTEDWLDASRLESSNVFFVWLEMSLQGVTRRERVSVPVFGTEQATEGTVFGD